jgi:hypothetical protein
VPILFPDDLDDVADKMDTDKIDDLVSRCARNMLTVVESDGENTV